MGRGVDRAGRRFRRCSPRVHHRRRPRRKRGSRLIKRNSLIRLVLFEVLRSPATAFVYELAGPRGEETRARMRSILARPGHPPSAIEQIFAIF